MGQEEIAALDPAKVRILIRCANPRDFERPPPFCIEGRPYIINTSDFTVIEETAMKRNLRQLALQTGINKNRIASVADKIGWRPRPSGLGSGENLLQ